MASVLKLGCHLCKKVENVPKKANLRRHYKLVHDIVRPAGMLYMYDFKKEREVRENGCRILFTSKSDRESMDG